MRSPNLSAKRVGFVHFGDKAAVLVVDGVFHNVLVGGFSLYKGVAHLLRYTVLCAGLHNAVDELLVGELDEQPSSIGVGVAVCKAYGAAGVVAVGLEVVRRVVG